LCEHHGRTPAARQSDHVDDETRPLLLMHMATAHIRVISIVVRIASIVRALPVTPPLYRDQLRTNMRLGLVALSAEAGGEQNAHGAEFSAAAWVGACQKYERRNECDMKQNAFKVEK
jgi:hypothetical protein